MVFYSTAEKESDPGPSFLALACILGSRVSSVCVCGGEQLKLKLQFLSIREAALLKDSKDAQLHPFSHGK